MWIVIQLTVWHFDVFRVLTLISDSSCYIWIKSDTSKHEGSFGGNWLFKPRVSIILVEIAVQEINSRKGFTEDEGMIDNVLENVAVSFLLKETFCSKEVDCFVWKMGITKIRKKDFIVSNILFDLSFQFMLYVFLFIISFSNKF